MKRIVLRAIDFSIRTLFKIKNKMTMSTEVQTENQIYVWTKTEKAGSIVVVAENQKDNEWLYFEDGTRINPSLVNEFLMEAKTMEEAKIHASSFGNTIGLTPTKTGPVEDHTNTTLASTSDPVITQPKEEPKAEVKEEVNVMMEMLSKMSKKNKASMPVEVHIPSTMVYEMLQDQMDLEPSDLNEQIGLLVENQINNLQEQLREQIQSFISNYYNNEHREHTESE